MDGLAVHQLCRGGKETENNSTGTHGAVCSPGTVHIWRLVAGAESPAGWQRYFVRTPVLSENPVAHNALALPTVCDTWDVETVARHRFG